MGATLRSPSEAAELVVDVRPAVAWVSSLPADWTSATERLVLLLLALDAFESTAAPGEENLMRWSGLGRSRLWEVLHGLSTPSEIRPALVERLDREGNPKVPGRSYGRSRTRYRLRVTVRPSGRLESYPQDDVVSGPPDGWEGQPSGRADGYGPVVSGQPSGQPSGPPDPPLPLPSVANSDLESLSRQTVAIAERTSCPTCHRSRTACERANRFSPDPCPPW